MVRCRFIVLYFSLYIFYVVGVRERGEVVDWFLGMWIWGERGQKGEKGS